MKSKILFLLMIASLIPAAVSSSLDDLSPILEDLSSSGRAVVWTFPDGRVGVAPRTRTLGATDPVVWHVEGSEVCHVNPFCSNMLICTDYTLSESEAAGWKLCSRCGGDQ